MVNVDVVISWTDLLQRFNATQKSHESNLNGNLRKARHGLSQLAVH